MPFQYSSLRMWRGKAFFCTVLRRLNHFRTLSSCACLSSIPKLERSNSDWAATVWQEKQKTKASEEDITISRVERSQLRASLSASASFLVKAPFAKRPAIEERSIRNYLKGSIAMILSADCIQRSRLMMATAYRLTAEQSQSCCSC